MKEESLLLLSDLQKLINQVVLIDYTIIILVGEDMRPPEIGNSTEEERRQYIKNTFRCIADCDMCGLCTVFHGKDPEVAYADYINGKRHYLDVSKDYR